MMILGDLMQAVGSMLQVLCQPVAKKLNEVGGWRRTAFRLTANQAVSSEAPFGFDWNDKPKIPFVTGILAHLVYKSGKLATV